MAETVADLRPADYNPRSITEQQLENLGRAMGSFGDLGVIVFNRRSGNLVGGHQRTRHLPLNAPIVVTERYPAPNAHGTVAVGYIEADGERWSYREVDVDQMTELAMNVAANKHGGSWDQMKLTPMLSELDANAFDMRLTGWDEKGLTQLLETTPAAAAGALGAVEYQLVVTCSGEEEQAQLCGELETRGLKCRMLTL